MIKNDNFNNVLLDGKGFCRLYYTEILELDKINDCNLLWLLYKKGMPMIISKNMKIRPDLENYNFGIVDMIDDEGRIYYWVRND